MDPERRTLVDGRRNLPREFGCSFGALFGSKNVFLRDAASMSDLGGTPSTCDTGQE